MFGACRGATQAKDEGIVLGRKEVKEEREGRRRDLHALLYFYILDLERRPLDIEEKKYLLDIEAVNETQCNMGKRERERESAEQEYSCSREDVIF